MITGKHQRRAFLSWLFVGTLAALCGLLAVLQYRWLGEVSEAARDRLHGSLQATLIRLSQGLNSELTADCAGLILQSEQSDRRPFPEQLAARYLVWKKNARHPQVVRRLALALPQPQQRLQLTMLNLQNGTVQESAWPPEWDEVKSRMETRLTPGRGEGDGRGDFGGPSSREGFTAEVPIFTPSGERGSGMPFGRREAGWTIVELDPQYLETYVLPEIVQRYLSAGGSSEYLVEVVERFDKKVIYQSDPRHGSIESTADASTSLFEPQQFLWQPGFGGRGPGPGRGPLPDTGRWQIFVRHRAGSLEAVVSQARSRNLAIAAGVLLLIVATSVALIRFTRRTQRLAELQMDFVAGVSHELKTPLTVIHTAAYNLQGKMAHDAGHVERYGALIQRESARLNAMVEQILSFATAESGRLLHERQPVSVAGIIEDAVAASKPILEAAHCVMEQEIAPGLPAVLGDRAALRQALENLVSNAAKYGLKDGNWIGISAWKTHEQAGDAVEIRVADHGPGIPREEQERIFDPFFRGARAREDQIRGTGLGLTLVKRIVEAHGGQIRVESAPAKGTAFVLRLPAAPAEAQG